MPMAFGASTQNSVKMVPCLLLLDLVFPDLVPDAHGFRRVDPELSQDGALPSPPRSCLPRSRPRCPWLSARRPRTQSRWCPAFSSSILSSQISSPMPMAFGASTQNSVKMVPCLLLLDLVFPDLVPDAHGFRRVDPELSQDGALPS